MSMMDGVGNDANSAARTRNAFAGQSSLEVAAFQDVFQLDAS